MRSGEQGTVLVILSVGFLVFLLLTGLVVDYGVKFRARQELQKWVDASALAGAMELSDANTAKEKAAYFYALNCSLATPPERRSGDCPSGCAAETSCYSVDADGVLVTTPYTMQNVSIPAKNLIHVTACREVELFFAPIIGIRTVHVCASATAKKTLHQTGSGIIVLDPTSGRSFEMTGGHTYLNLSEGKVIVDSNSRRAFVFSGGGSITASGVDITGNYIASGNSAFFLPNNADPSTGVAPTPDPLASLPDPSPSGMPVYPGARISASTATLQPGVYTRAITISGGSSVTFAPGTYILQGGITVSGTSTIIGNGVMLFNQQGKITISGTSSVQFTPPSSGTYEGITMFQGRDNTAKAVLSGTSDSVFAGTYYFPITKLLEMSGGSNLKLGSVITWHMLLSGGSFEVGSVSGPSSSSSFIALIE
jgi:hypothetical protein